MVQDPDLTAVIEAWPRLAPDARRMLRQLADAPQEIAQHDVPLGDGGWPVLRSSTAWERHDDPELS